MLLNPFKRLEGITKFIKNKMSERSYLNHKNIQCLKAAT